MRGHGRACVVVLGDIGRSPRMQYPALSLAHQASLEVDIVAYGGSEPHAAVQENGSIHIHTMKQWRKLLQSLPKILYPLTLLLKPIFQFVMLLWFLCIKVPRPDVFIVQNPPSVPTLVAVKWASSLRQFEKHYGKKANGSLCVTRAMQHELAQNWEIRATVLYDQLPVFFHQTSLEEKHMIE
ncbi:hypothetical protein SLA2020_432550 [Shorea laevis]